MPSPVTPSADPRDNAPLSAGVLTGALVAVIAATQGMPAWFVLGAFVVIVAAMVAAQMFTRRA